MNLLFSLVALMSFIKAADESLFDQFLGSPLLALAAIAVIVVFAFIYHKIRR